MPAESTLSKRPHLTPHDLHHPTTTTTTTKPSIQLSQQPSSSPPTTTSSSSSFSSSPSPTTPPPSPPPPTHPRPQRKAATKARQRLLDAYALYPFEKEDADTDSEDTFPRPRAPRPTPVNSGDESSESDSDSDDFVDESEGSECSGSGKGALEGKRKRKRERERSVSEVNGVGDGGRRSLKVVEMEDRVGKDGAKGFVVKSSDVLKHMLLGKASRASWGFSTGPAEGLHGGYWGQEVRRAGLSDMGRTIGSNTPSWRHGVWTKGLEGSTFERRKGGARGGPVDGSGYRVSRFSEQF